MPTRKRHAKMFPATRPPLRQRFARTIRGVHAKTRMVGTVLLVVALAAPAALTLAGSVPAEASASVLDLTGVVHPQPPLSPLPNGDPFKADRSLLDQVVVDICRITATGCTRVQLLSARTPSLTGQLRLVLHQYITAWNALGTQVGERYRINFRVAGMNVSHVDMAAVGPLGLLQPYAFLAGTVIPIVFSIDNNPVVRTRSLHDRGQDATQLGGILKSEFKLSVDDAFRVLWNDIRGEEIDMAGTASAPSATAGMASASAGPQAAIASSADVVPPPTGPSAFTLQQVVDSVTFAGSFGATAKQAAGLAKAQTDATNQQIINALVNGANLPGVTSTELLALIRDTLGVTDLNEQLRLLVNATKGGKPAFSATDVLAALANLDPLPSVLDALKRLQGLGYPADPALLAVKTVFAQKGVPATASTAASAVLQVLGAGFSTPEIVSALKNPMGFNVPDPLALLVNEAMKLVGSSCTAYKALPPTAGSIPGIISQRKDVLSAVDVGGALRTPTVCGFSPLDMARALQSVYYGALDRVDQGDKLAAALVAPVPSVGPLSASVLVTTLGAVLKDAAPRPDIDDTVACATAAGSVTGGKKSLQNDVFSNLDGHPDLFGSPFAVASNGAPGSPLDKLGGCLAGLGVKIPFPLLKVHVVYTHADIPATSAVTNDTFVVGRVGWLPALPNLPVPTPADVGALNAVPAVGGVRVPSLGKALASATMLPSLAIGNLGAESGCLWYNANLGDACSTAAPSGFDIPSYDPRHVAPSPYVTFGTALPGAPAPGVGDFTMIIPALPGALNMEASTLVNPNLACSGSRNPPVEAAATVAPADLYKALPGGDQDFLATGQLSIPLDGHTPLSGDFRIDETTEDHCGRLTTQKAGVSFHIEVTPLGVTDVATGLPGAIAQLGQTTLTETQGLITAGGQVRDFRLNAASALTSVDPAGLTGNLLSILAQQAAPVTGSALKMLITTGFLP